MIALVPADLEALAAHLGHATTPETWSEHLAAVHRSLGPIDAPWELASEGDDHALETWVATLTLFDRRLAIAAALAATEHVLPCFDDAMRAPDVDLRVLAENVARGFTHPPSAQLAAARAWLDAPSDALAIVADATLEGSEPPDLSLPEMAPLRSRAWIWVVEAAADTASAPAHPDAARMTSRAVVAAARALRCSGASAARMAQLDDAVRAAVRSRTS